MKKSIWIIFYFLFLFGLFYLISSIVNTWQYLQTRTSDELAFLNKIFSSSVTTTFDQHEIMLELLGQELISIPADRFSDEAPILLDRLLAKQQSIVGFGLADVNGKLLVTSSNVDMTIMPNLKVSESSSYTFNQALMHDQMVLGRTYYLDALNSWIMPIRKAIRSEQGKVMAVMTAAIKPQDLLPQMNELAKQKRNKSKETAPFQSSLLHDNSFYYAYLSGVKDIDLIKNIINEPLDTEFLLNLGDTIELQTGLSMRDIKNQPVSLEFSAIGYDGKDKFLSLRYIPKYQLWSMTFLPREHVMAKIKSNIGEYIIAFISVVIVIFILFRYINKFEKNNRKQLLNQANHDFLTGLHNRLFLEYAEPKWIYEGAPPFSVIFTDLDNFKNINDSYGHSIGDEILIEVADRFRDFFDKDCLICRQGGDEFIVLCPTVDEKQLEIIAQQLIEKISQPYSIGQYNFSLGGSIGICRYPSDGESFDSLFSAADTAMYEAKNKNNSYFVFTREMHENIIKKSNIEQAFHGALQSNEFFMVYQPQITSSGELYGVEALIRWINKDLGFIPPDQFISIAEDSGLILELGHFILRQSIQDIALLKQQNSQNDLRLSINISVRQFLEGGFLDQVKAALEEFHFPAEHLTLEITESIFIDDIEYMLPLFKAIMKLGIKFSLDDFGTGFSSLSMLRQLPIDELKIDKSFIDHITDDPQDKAMVLNILNIAINLNLLVVAEGIETQEQRDLLIEISCDVQQGYLHSRPIKIDELIEFAKQFQKSENIA